MHDGGGAIDLNHTLPLRAEETFIEGNMLMKDVDEIHGDAAHGLGRARVRACFRDRSQSAAERLRLAPVFLLSGLFG